ncbi:MAG: ATP synthase F0 subunit C [Deltaproteobacteria bacterium]|nr:ATP synthase F0 subunit C [Deltaproteobacteria bacterium]
MKKLVKLFASISAFVAVALAAASTFAQEAAAASSSNVGTGTGMLAIAVAVGIGIAAFGGAFGQGRTAAAALEGIARNPNASDKVFVPMILALAFIESLVLFTWVLMLLMQLKI